MDITLAAPTAPPPRPGSRAPGRRTRFARQPRPGRLAAAALVCAAVMVVQAGAPSPVAAQEGLCAVAGAIVQDELGMVAEALADTIPDWRTRQVKDGCRLTAAGGARDMQFVVDALGAGLQARGWVSFSDAAMSAHGTTFAYGRDDVECSLGVFPAGALGTPQERALQGRATAGPGQRRYTVTATCIPQGG